MAEGGQRIGENYEIAEVLGRGAMGTVYSGTDLRTGRKVAIKSLQIQGGFGPEDPDLQRFEQEARIAGSLSSPHIAHVLDIGREPETDAPFLVMEHLVGEDIEAAIERVGPLPVDVALSIAEQACAGLEAAHSAGVVHRDIKPANLFLSRADDGRIMVKILDFGIAKIRRLPPDAAAAGALTAPQVSLTATGQILGSPLYMSPEQVDGTTGVDARADVYSLGLTLYAMLTGAAPHRDAKSFVELLYAIQNVPTRPVREMAPWVPAEVEALVSRATMIDRDKRFFTIAAMHSAIRALVSENFALREEKIVRASAETLPRAPRERRSDPQARTMAAPAKPPPERPSRNAPQIPIRAVGIAVGIVATIVVIALWLMNV